MTTAEAITVFVVGVLIIFGICVGLGSIFIDAGFITSHEQAQLFVLLFWVPLAFVVDLAGDLR